MLEQTAERLTAILQHPVVRDGTTLTWCRIFGASFRLLIVRYALRAELRRLLTIVPSDGAAAPPLLGGGGGPGDADAVLTTAPWGRFAAMLALAALQGIDMVAIGSYIDAAVMREWANPALKKFRAPLLAELDEAMDAPHPSRSSPSPHRRGASPGARVAGSPNNANPNNHAPVRGRGAGGGADQDEVDDPTDSQAAAATGPGAGGGGGVTDSGVDEPHQTSQSPKGSFPTPGEASINDAAAGRRGRAAGLSAAGADSDTSPPPPPRGRLWTTRRRISAWTHWLVTTGLECGKWAAPRGEIALHACGTATVVVSLRRFGNLVARSLSWGATACFVMAVEPPSPAAVVRTVASGGRGGSSCAVDRFHVAVRVAAMQASDATTDGWMVYGMLRESLGGACMRHLPAVARLLRPLSSPPSFVESERLVASVLLAAWHPAIVQGVATLLALLWVNSGAASQFVPMLRRRVHRPIYRRFPRLRAPLRGFEALLTAHGRRLAYALVSAPFAMLKLRIFMAAMLGAPYPTVLDCSKQLAAEGRATWIGFGQVTLVHLALSFVNQIDSLSVMSGLISRLRARWGPGGAAAGAPAHGQREDGGAAAAGVVGGDGAGGDPFMGEGAEGLVPLE